MGWHSLQIGIVWPLCHLAFVSLWVMGSSSGQIWQTVDNKAFIINCMAHFTLKRYMRNNSILFNLFFWVILFEIYSADRFYILKTQIMNN